MDLRRKIMTTKARETLLLVTQRRRSPSAERPNMCDLRIVLLGNNVEKNSTVGNIILGRSAFEKQSPPAGVEHRSERGRGKVEDKHVTVINCPHLLHLELSLYQITEAVKECVLLSAPGPHVLILILQHESFNEDDMKRVKTVLYNFSDQAIKRTIVLTTDQEKLGSDWVSVAKHNLMHQLIKDCGGKHVKFDDIHQRWCSEIFKKIEKVCKENSEEFLICEVYEEAEEGTSVEYKESRRTDISVRRQRDMDHEEKKIRDSQNKNKMGQAFSKFKNMIAVTGREQNQPTALQNMSKLNLVMCGSDEILKGSVSNLILRERRSTHSSLCTVQEGEVCGRLINLVELPALFNTQLTEEEVRHETLHCVSLCDPGVHAFLLVIPDGPLTDENRGEIEKIKKLFHTTEHFILLYTTDYTAEAPVTDFVKSITDCQRLIGQPEDQYKFVELKEHGESKQIPELLDYIERTMTEAYSLQTYMKAQEQRVRHELNDELNKLKNEIKELQQKIQSESEDTSLDLNCLRIVLIGKTGNGKSETGNTILGREEFYTEASSDSVTSVCMKRVCEIEGKSVAVVDTPGLFDTGLSNEHVLEEIVKCILLSAPGPHVFIIVLSVGRFTKEEKDTVDLIWRIFGPMAAQFSIVLFTRGDDLKNRTIKEYVEKSNNAVLKKLIRDCGNRFLVFNNREKQNSTQVTQLLNMIEDVKKSNQGKYFTNDMFQEAEMSIKKKVEAILKEKEREIQIQKEELKAQYDIEMDTIVKRLEEEKRRADEERLQMEIKFRENEDSLRKEFEEKEKSEQKKREMDEQMRSDEEKQLKADYYKNIEEMKREIENQRSQYEKEKKQREEKIKKQEEKYIEDKEKLKSRQKQAMEELKRKQKEEIDNREKETIRKKKEEEEERQRWERKIKEAENDKIEIQEEIKRQQKEWEMEKKRQMKEQEEDERKKREQHIEQLKEKQDELEKLRKKFEREREEENQQREEERHRWRDAEKKQRDQKEREYEEKKNKMQKHYEQLERERKEEWERRKREEDERREEERKKWEKKIEDIKQNKEEEIRKREKEEESRKEREKRERDKMKQEHEEELEKVKRKHEDAARKHAEEFNEFRDNKEQYIQELTSKLKENQKVHDILEKLYQHFKTQSTKETTELKAEIEQLKNSQSCVIS